MADAKSKKKENLATEVAKTVGGALGTIAATASRLVDAAQSETSSLAEPQRKPKAVRSAAKSAPAKTAKKTAARGGVKSASVSRNSAAKKKAQHKKKIARKTGG